MGRAGSIGFSLLTEGARMATCPICGTDGGYQVFTGFGCSNSLCQNFRAANNTFASCEELEKTKNYNCTHPELLPGEVFFGNCFDTTEVHCIILPYAFENIPWTTKRKGCQAYISDGDPISKLFPVFVKLYELLAAGGDLPIWYLDANELSKISLAHRVSSILPIDRIASP